MQVNFQEGCQNNGLVVESITGGTFNFNAGQGVTVEHEAKDVDVSILQSAAVEAVWQQLRVDGIVDERNRAQMVWQDAVIADEMGEWLHLTRKWVMFTAYWGCPPTLANNMRQKQVDGRDSEDMKKFRRKVRKALSKYPAVIQ